MCRRPRERNRDLKLGSLPLELADDVLEVLDGGIGRQLLVIGLLSALQRREECLLHGPPAGFHRLDPSEPGLGGAAMTEQSLVEVRRECRHRPRLRRAGGEELLALLLPARSPGLLESAQHGVVADPGGVLVSGGVTHEGDPERVPDRIVRIEPALQGGDDEREPQLVVLR